MVLNEGTVILLTFLMLHLLLILHLFLGVTEMVSVSGGIAVSLSVYLLAVEVNGDDGFLLDGSLNDY